MKLKIAPEIFERFPGLNVGIVIAKQISNIGASDEVMVLVQEKQRKIRKNFTQETISQYQRIDSWREAYSSFGAKPKKHKCSVESIYRMILEGIDLQHINKIVDIYNYISIKHMVPVGGDDIEKVEGDITLKFAQGGEPFTPLNSTEKESVREGEVVYADEVEVLCRRWNWRECDKTKMREETKDVILVAEGLPPVAKEEMETIVEDLSRLVKKYCGGEIRKDVLDEMRREVQI